MWSLQFLDSLERAEPNFLSSPEWMTIPWLTRQKTPNDKLVDVLSYGPALLRKAFSLDFPAKMPEGVERFTLVLEIIRDLATVLHALELFYEDLESTVTGPLYWQVEENNEEESELHYPPSLYFEDVGIASALVLYCTSPISFSISTRIVC
jgi:hypothetical protein